MYCNKYFKIVTVFYFVNFLGYNWPMTYAITTEVWSYLTNVSGYFAYLIRSCFVSIHCVLFPFSVHVFKENVWRLYSSA